MRNVGRILGLCAAGAGVVAVLAGVGELVRVWLIFSPEQTENYATGDGFFFSSLGSFALSCLLLALGCFVCALLADVAAAIGKRLGGPRV